MLKLPFFITISMYNKHMRLMLLFSKRFDMLHLCQLNNLTISVI